MFIGGFKIFSWKGALYQCDVFFILSMTCFCNTFIINNEEIPHFATLHSE